MAAREMLSRCLEFRVHLHVQSLESTLFLHYFALEWHKKCCTTHTGIFSNQVSIIFM